MKYANQNTINNIILQLLKNDKLIASITDKSYSNLESRLNNLSGIYSISSIYGTNNPTINVQSNPATRVYLINTSCIIHNNLTISSGPPLITISDPIQYGLLFTYVLGVNLYTLYINRDFTVIKSNLSTSTVMTDIYTGLSNDYLTNSQSTTAFSTLGAHTMYNDLYARITASTPTSISEINTSIIINGGTLPFVLTENTAGNSIYLKSINDTQCEIWIELVNYQPIVNTIEGSIGVQSLSSFIGNSYTYTIPHIGQVTVSVSTSSISLEFLRNPEMQDSVINSIYVLTKN